MVQFAQHIHNLNSLIFILVIAGVIQAQSISNSVFNQAGHEKLSLVALRLLDNQFTGKGITDTGNRLFNTTHLL